MTGKQPKEVAPRPRLRAVWVMNTALLETSTATCGRLRCRELGVVHAEFDDNVSTALVCVFLRDKVRKDVEKIAIHSTLFPGRLEAIMSSRYLAISSLTFLRP